jgi:hypothetical protein
MVIIRMLRKVRGIAFWKCLKLKELILTFNMINFVFCLKRVVATNYHHNCCKNQGE